MATVLARQPALRCTVNLTSAVQLFYCSAVLLFHWHIQPFANQKKESLFTTLFSHNPKRLIVDRLTILVEAIGLRHGSVLDLDHIEVASLVSVDLRSRSIPAFVLWSLKSLTQ